MNENTENDIKIELSRNLLNFIFKTIVVTTAFTLSISILAPDMPKIQESEKNKLILLGFVQNPFVLWRLSVLQEEKGNLKNATTYMEAAIGLMEMHGASDKSLKKYKDRLNELSPK